MSNFIKNSPMFRVDGIIRTLQSLTTLKLKKYCVKRIIALKMGPKNFDFDFTINEREYLPSIKTISKLKVLVYKYVTKNIPYIHFCDSELLQMHDKETIALVLNTSYRERDFSKYFSKINDKMVYEENFEPSDYHIASSGGARLICVEEEGSFKSINRYVELLNRKCILNKIPISLKVDTELIFDRLILDKVNFLPSEKKFDIATKIPCRYTTSILIRFHKWIYEENGWNSYPLIFPISTGRSTISPEDDCLFSIEKIFMHMDKITQVVSTLSRKARYESPAYDLRDI